MLLRLTLFFTQSTIQDILLGKEKGLLMRREKKIKLDVNPRIMLLKGLNGFDDDWCGGLPYPSLSKETALVLKEIEDD